AICGILLIVFVVLLILFVLRRRAKKNRDEEVPDVISLQRPQLGNGISTLPQSYQTSAVNQSGRQGVYEDATAAFDDNQLSTYDRVDDVRAPVPTLEATGTSYDRVED